MKALLVIACVALCGCVHVPPGGASEARVSVGVPGVFQLKKEVTGVKVTDRTIKAADTKTDLTIFLFSWASSAKDVVLTNPSEKP
jgi:hypothetical protein